MPGIAQRRGRRDPTVGGGNNLELWKRVHCLGLILFAPIVAPQATNDGESNENKPDENARWPVEGRSFRVQPHS